MWITQLAQAQQNPSLSPPDSAIKPSPDSIALTDTLPLPQQVNKSLETTLSYSAQDSIVSDLEGKKAYLYGKAHVEYGDFVLDAHQIELDQNTNTIFARGRIDPVSGRYMDRPTFVQNGEVSVVDSMKYNGKTGKGLIYGPQYKEGEGYLGGKVGKRTEESICLREGHYTTCNLAHPHFRIKASKLKLIPGEKVVAGPFNLEIADIPTPLGFWMGYFPMMDRQKSGIIFPTFGENRDRGFFLQQGGYYWAVNDYLALKVLGDAYTNGSWRSNFSADYTKKYRYDGDLAVNIARLKSGFDEGALPKQFNVFWTHRSLSRRPGNFTAKVNFSSNSYNNNIGYNPTTIQTNTSNSTVTYSRQFKFGSLSLTGNADQNFRTREMNTTLPQMNFSLNRFAPLKSKRSSGNKWFEKIYVSYQANARYSLTNKFKDPTVSDNPLYPTVFKDTIYDINETTLREKILPNGQWAVQHSIPIQATYKIMRYLNFNPQANYTEYWYQRQYTYTYDASAKYSKISDTTKGFYRAYSYNVGATFNTTLYGTYRFRGKNIMRHIMIPNLGYTYSPDFSNPEYGFYQEMSNDLTSKGEARRYNRYSGLGYGSPGNVKQSSLRFSLTNTLEIKVRDRKDSTGIRKTKNVKLIDNLSLDGTYNFAADSLRLSVISLSARTNLFSNRMNINFNSSWDPYSYVLDSTSSSGFNYQRRVNEFALSRGMGLAKVERYNLAFSTNLNPKALKPRTHPNPDAQRQLAQINANPEMYVDFTIPWNLNLGYNLAYTKTGFNPRTLTQAINMSGDLLLTPKWKIKVSTGYDLVGKRITNSRIDLDRDLHCWQMTFSTVPFGINQSFVFTLQAKSALLQDLKVNKRSNGYIGYY